MTKKQYSVNIPIGEVWELINKPRRFFQTLSDELFKLEEQKDNPLSAEWGIETKREVMDNVLKWKFLGKNPIQAKSDCKRSVTEVLKFFDSYCSEMTDKMESEIMIKIADMIYECYGDDYYDEYARREDDKKDKKK